MRLYKREIYRRNYAQGTHTHDVCVCMYKRGRKWSKNIFIHTYTHDAAAAAAASAWCARV